MKVYQVEVRSDVTLIDGTSITVVESFNVFSSGELAQRFIDNADIVELADGLPNPYFAIMECTVDQENPNENWSMANSIYYSSLWTDED